MTTLTLTLTAMSPAEAKRAQRQAVLDAIAALEPAESPVTVRRIVEALPPLPMQVTPGLVEYRHAPDRHIRPILFSLVAAKRVRMHKPANGVRRYGYTLTENAR